jgi:hypothetical protein
MLKTLTVTFPSSGALKLMVTVPPCSGLKMFLSVTAGTSAVAVGSGVLVRLKVGVMVKDWVWVGLKEKVAL